MQFIFDEMCLSVNLQGIGNILNVITFKTNYIVGFSNDFGWVRFFFLTLSQMDNRILCPASCYLIWFNIAWMRNVRYFNIYSIRVDVNIFSHLLRESANTSLTHRISTTESKQPTTKRLCCKLIKFNIWAKSTVTPQLF